MGTVRLVSAAVYAEGANINRYFHNHSIHIQTSAQTNAERAMGVSGTFGNLFLNVTANTLVTAGCTVSIRKNSADTAVIFTVATSATGLFEDTTHTATCIATDLMAYKMTTAGATTGSITHGILSATFAADTNTFSLHGGSELNVGITYTDATQYYVPLDLLTSGITTESDAKTRIRTAGTFKKAGLYVVTNTVSSTYSVKLRKNGADATIAISITADTTGTFEDTSNTDSASVGDDFNWDILPPTEAGTNTTIIKHLDVGFETTNNQFELGSGALAATQATNLTRYYPLATNITAFATEADVHLTMRIANLLAKEMKIEVSANSYTTLATLIDVRQNSGNAGIQVSVAAAATGVFTTSGSVSIATTDECDYRIITPNETGTLTIQQLSSLWDTTVPSAGFIHSFGIVMG